MIYAFWVNGFEGIEAITPIDLLRRANIDIKTVSMEETRCVKNSSNVKYVADIMFEDCDFSDLTGIFLSGGPGTSGYMNHPKLLELIKETHQSGKLISAICAAPSIFANIGINPPMTVYPSMICEIKNYVPEGVVVSENVITGEAVGSAIDFSLALIKYIKGEEEANKIAKSICKR